MPTRRLLLALVIASVALAAGCAVFQPATPASPREVAEPAPAESPEPPQIVAAPESASPATPGPQTTAVDPHVGEFLERMERAQAARTQRPPSRDRPPLRYSEDEIEEIGPIVRADTPAPPSSTAANTEAPTNGSEPPDRVELAAAQAELPPAEPQPPKLTGAVVRADTGPTPRAADSLPPPRVNTPVAAAASTADLRDYLERSTLPEDAAFSAQLDRRMLFVIAGEYDRAREPLQLVTAEQQELATRFIEAQIAIREGHAGDPAQAAAAAASELAALQQALRKLSDLSVPVARICSAVRGFGQYDPIEPARFSAGGSAEFVLYCEVKDFATERREDGFYHTTFDLRTTIVDRAGNVVLDLKDPDITDRSRNRRQDCFLPRLVRLPPTLAPGSYVAKVSVTDKLGQRVAENRATFELVAKP